MNETIGGIIGICTEFGHTVDLGLRSKAEAEKNLRKAIRRYFLKSNKEAKLDLLYAYNACDLGELTELLIMEFYASFNLFLSNEELDELDEPELSESELLELLNAPQKRDFNFRF